MRALAWKTSSTLSADSSSFRRWSPRNCSSANKSTDTCSMSRYCSSPASCGHRMTQVPCDGGMTETVDCSYCPATYETFETSCQSAGGTGASDPRGGFSSRLQLTTLTAGESGRLTLTLVPMPCLYASGACSDSRSTTHFMADLVTGLGLLDLLRYLVLAAIWIFAGRSLLVALRQTELGTTGGYSALDDTGVRGHHSRDERRGWMANQPRGGLGLAGGYCFGGVRHRSRVARSKVEPSSLPAAISDGALIAGIAVIVPAIVLLPYLVWGFGGFAATDHPDAWSYTVFGAYLWEFPRGTQGGLAPIYQWAANLSGTRFVGASRARLARHGHPRTGYSGGVRSPAHARHIYDRKRVGRCRTRPGFVESVYLPARPWLGGRQLDRQRRLGQQRRQSPRAPALPALATLGLHQSATALSGKVRGCWTAHRRDDLYVSGICACDSLLRCSVLHQSGVRLATRERPLSAVLIAVVTAGVLVWPYANQFFTFFRSSSASGVPARLAAQAKDFSTD